MASAITPGIGWPAVMRAGASVVSSASTRKSLSATGWSKGQLVDIEHTTPDITEGDAQWSDHVTDTEYAGDQ